MQLARKLAVGIVVVVSAMPLTACFDDDPDDGGPATADTGPTTPTDTIAETGTPERPSQTDATVATESSTSG